MRESVSGRTITSASRKKRSSPSAAPAPRLRAAAGPMRPPVGTTRSGKPAAMARDWSVEPSSTSTTSKSPKLERERRVRHSASVASAL